MDNKPNNPVDPMRVFARVYLKIFNAFMLETRNDVELSRLLAKDAFAATQVQNKNSANPQLSMLEKMWGEEN